MRRRETGQTSNFTYVSTYRQKVNCGLSVAGCPSDCPSTSPRLPSKSQPGSRERSLLPAVDGSGDDRPREEAIQQQGVEQGHADQHEVRGVGLDQLQFAQQPGQSERDDPGVETHADAPE